MKSATFQGIAIEHFPTKSRDIGLERNLKIMKYEIDNNRANDYMKFLYGKELIRHATNNDNEKELEESLKLLNNNLKNKEK